MMFDTTARHNYNNSEAVISYVNLRPEQ